ncbi:MaoC family dehydratase [Oceanospirillaceae bacterium]|nr:MaoC family dehydratase [Oceanospirillaceae bacterium]MBT4997934.1 MaoC family dehydratase [Oceanospirillaceae bacterium]MBT5629756.1 MaoC family dehydratase [Oceanospirillaceae bacterium]MBT6101283.1 MaoC family dehydratase [Oceanospirillaceae bacterium]MBT7673726.1 MaoC family dehydratase [Oceanospirillaceae bacterium]
MNNQHGYYLEDLTIGMESSYQKTITETDIDAFAALTGDTNPVHLDSEYAATTPFKARIAHGMLSAGLISTVLGTQLPGPGCIYLEQQIKFKAPVFIGDTLVATVTVADINQRRGRVSLKTQCFVNTKLVADGTASMMVDKKS